MLKDLALKNRSYRGFDSSVKVTMQNLEELVSVARLCAAGANKQPLKYFLSADDKTNEAIFKHTNWAMMLKQSLPYEGHEPTGYVVICVDTSISANPDACGKDVGIVAQTMMLQAVELGFGGCMIGAFNSADVAKELNLDEKYKPNLILAIGKPDETVVITDIKDGETKYYRDEKDVHYVPKRTVDELIIK